MKTPGESAIETRYLVMPDQVNHYGTTFGGVILSWIDMAAAMVAERHCEGEAVTVSIALARLHGKNKFLVFSALIVIPLRSC